MSQCATEKKAAPASRGRKVTGGKWSFFAITQINARTLCLVPGAAPPTKSLRGRELWPRPFVGGTGGEVTGAWQSRHLNASQPATDSIKTLGGPTVPKRECCTAIAAMRHVSSLVSSSVVHGVFDESAFPNSDAALSRFSVGCARQ